MHGGELVQVVQHYHRLRAGSQLDYDTHALAVGLVSNLGNALKPLVLRQAGNLLHERGFVHLIGQLGNDYLHAVGAAHRLYLSLRPHDNLAAPCRVCVANAFTSHDSRAGREVGSRHMLHQILDRGVGTVDEVNDGVADFRRIVGRYVRRHAHRDAGSAVYHQVWQAGRQYDRFTQRAVEVVYEVNRVLVDIDKHLFGDRSQSRFRVAHSRGRVVVHAAEVSLSVNQWKAHSEVLRHTHHRFIDGIVVVWVILAEHLTDKARALLVRLRGAHAQFVHRVQDTPLHRLQPVAHIRQRARHDYAHRVVEVRSSHFLFDLRGLDEAVFGLQSSHQRLLWF